MAARSSPGKPTSVVAVTTMIAPWAGSVSITDHNPKVNKDRIIARNSIRIPFDNAFTATNPFQRTVSQGNMRRNTSEMCLLDLILSTYGPDIL
jgi:ABC-type antimicrobial peptide transport system ATPase subunit